jgi:uncharacterized protein (TIGR02099 family)
MPASSSTSSRAKRFLRLVAMSALLLLGAFFALLLAVRLVVFPQIEARHDAIARWMGTRIGQPVEIDNVVTGWDGWNPKLSIRGFRVRARDAAGGALLELPRVDLLIAWTSLPLADLRLKELLIEGPRLSLRRDTAGRLHLAGLEGEPEAAADDSAFADWLMRQPQVVVHDALVAWNDEYRHAPQLLLDHVAFRLENRFGRHRAGLTGIPPADLAAPLELRADVTGHSLKDWSNLEGKLYLRLDYADVAAWREWLPLPVPVESGKGAMRVWIDFAQSQPVDVTADLELEDVRATLGDGLAPLSLAHLAGRAHWKRTGPLTELSAQRLTFSLADGTALAPANLRLTLGGADSLPRGGSVAFEEIDLRPLAAVAPYMPFPERLRRDIARYDPRGTLRNGTFEWTGGVEAPERYSVKTEFRNVALAPQDGMPGAANLSGNVEADERTGRLHLDSQSATVALPRLFAEPLAFDSLRADVGWQHDGADAQLQFKDVGFANADVAGTTAGTWHSRPGGPGDVDARAQLTRVNLAGVHRYLPLGAGSAIRDWLRNALPQGTSGDASLVLAGDLAQFPFAGGKGGQLLFVAKAHDATLRYAESWPAITDIAGDVRIEGTRLLVTASAGRVLGAQIGATRAEIADLHDASPLLQIDGVASGPTREFLAFVAQTPITAWIGNVTQGATAEGDGRLALKFELPLRDRAAVKIDGHYQFLSNAVRLPAVPALADVAGTLDFTERDVHAGDVTATALGGPLKLDVASAAGQVRVTGSGTADLQQVRTEYDLPLFDRITGTTNWKLTLQAREHQIGWAIDSTLEGATLDLPVPFRKAAAEKVALRVERREPRANEDRIVVEYGTAARLVLHRQLGGSAASVDRALVLLGKAAAENVDAEQPGVWVRGDVPALALDEWLAVDTRADAGSAAAGAGGSSGLALTGVDLTAGTLEALGRKFTRLRTSARRQGNDWRLTLDGNELAGTAVWRGATPAQPNGRIAARLARLTTPPAADAVTAAGAAPSPTSTGAADRWPEVDIVAEALRSKERTLGKLELLAQPAGADWQIRKLALINDFGRIDAEGSWRNVSSRSQTHLNVVVDVKEAGEFLGRFGWPNAVRNAPTRIDGQLSWDGAPSDFDYPTLSGTLKLRSGAGQFTKVDPGVGRLLGVLSLQALPRRISLDFRDVFSEGFAFDTIAADVRMHNGVMHTDDFRLVGPAAAVNIAGDVDIAAETQQLKVRVQPSLSSGVSAGAAALFIANPLIGAAVGAGTLLAQKMLNNPFDQLFSYEYAVTGSWDDPVVTRVGRDATAAQSGATIR